MFVCVCMHTNLFYIYDFCSLLFFLMSCEVRWILWACFKTSSQWTEDMWTKWENEGKDSVRMRERERESERERWKEKWFCSGMSHVPSKVSAAGSAEMYLPEVQLRQLNCYRSLLKWNKNIWEVPGSFKLGYSFSFFHSLSLLSTPPPIPLWISKPSYNVDTLGWKWGVKAEFD